MKKKTLAALLALCMALSLLPAAAFAADGEGEGEENPPVQPPAERTCVCTENECSHNENPEAGIVCGAPVDGEKTLCATCEEYQANKGEGGNKPGEGDVECSGNAECAREAADGHKAGCKKACNGEENCPNVKLGYDLHKDGGACKSLCTLSLSCGEGPNPCRAHRENCLSLCTMSSSCPNSVGDPSMHQMKYAILEGNMQVDETTPLFNTRDEAQAEADNRNGPNQAAGHDTNWRVVTVSCPQARVSDSVVLGDPSGDKPEEKPDPKPGDKAPAKAEDFTDVPEGAWYAGELTALMEKGYLRGEGESFNPAGSVSGGQVAVILARIAGEKLDDTGADWAAAALAWAAENGYTEGIQASATGALARKDLVLMLWRAAGKPQSDQALNQFSDVGGLDGDHLAAMRWAVEQGIVKGNPGGAAAPDQPASRAEMVALLTRYDGVVNGK